MDWLFVKVDEVTPNVFYFIHTSAQHIIDANAPGIDMLHARVQFRNYVFIHSTFTRHTIITNEYAVNVEMIPKCHAVMFSTMSTGFFFALPTSLPPHIMVANSTVPPTAMRTLFVNTVGTQLFITHRAFSSTC